MAGRSQHPGRPALTRAARTPPATGTVTLLTGDKVVVSASGHRVEPA